ncbi:PAS domain S-box protein [Cytobacillus suaedae]|nr:PAS domain S-box protein [Cytobacillus suaedae]
MIEKYKGRLIATITFIFAISIWNFIYYYYNNYSFNLLLDLSYTVIVALVVWWLASYYDKSKVLLKELKSNEEEYKKLSESTTYVFENLNQVVYQTDCHAVFTLLNSQWERLTGFTVQETVGKSIFMFIYPEDLAIATEKAESYKQNKEKVLQEEMRFRKKDGGFIWLQINTKINYNPKNDMLSTVGTLTDITEWKISEKELLQINEDLAMKSDKLSVIAQMSAAIAHEVRNPLTSINGFLQLLQEQKHLKDEYLEIIFSEMKRIELVLNEMLMLSKPQSILFDKVDLVRTLDHVLALISSEANMKSIELIKETGKEPVWVYGDENQLKQVFINIIKNGIESMTTGGKIHIYLATNNEFVSIYFRDEGSGISPETLRKIGQPFYTTKEKGTGLGLTICFKIIENHRGKIHITSQVKVGTTFEVILPCHLPAITENVS